MIGAKEKLFAKVPFSMMSVSGRPARKPRCQISDAKFSRAEAPGASGVSNR
jgi:hypothetical protein